MKKKVGVAAAIAGLMLLLCLSWWHWASPTRIALLNFQDFQTAKEVMARLSAKGIGFALDDFGSRYANLSLFTDVRFDTVKLDRSLIGTMAENGVSRMLVKDLVTISHSRDMICVAEGVEKEEQVAALLDAGCSYAQGYFFGRPLPASEFEDGYLSHGRAAVQCASHTGQEYSKEDRHE